MFGTVLPWSYKYKHPALFPVELPLRLIHYNTFEDDVVFDLFMGSGTIAEAALLSNNRYVEYEISEKYVTTPSERLHVLPIPNTRDQNFFYNQCVAEYCGVGFWPDPLIQTQEIEWIVGVQAGPATGSLRPILGRRLEPLRFRV